MTGVATPLGFLFFLSLSGGCHGWWPFSTSQEPAEASSRPQIAEGEEKQVRHVPAKFEVATAEQKFLAEAQKYMELSALEKCQHAVSTGHGAVVSVKRQFCCPGR